MTININNRLQNNQLSLTSAKVEVLAKLYLESAPSEVSDEAIAEWH